MIIINFDFYFSWLEFKRVQGKCRTGGFDDVVSSGVAPLDLGRVQLVGDANGLAIHQQLAVVHDDGAGVLAVHSVVLNYIWVSEIKSKAGCQLNKKTDTYVEHVLHVVNGNERIVDSNNLDLRIQPGSAQDETTDASKPVNSDFDSRPIGMKCSYPKQLKNSIQNINGKKR